jgi:hypothetical protein
MRPEDGLVVMVMDQKVGTFEVTAKSLLSPDIQRLNHISDVEVSRRPQGTVKRAFIKMLVTEKTGVQYRRIVVIDDGRSAASVIANVPKKAFDADPSIAVAWTSLKRRFSEGQLSCHSRSCRRRLPVIRLAGRSKLYAPANAVHCGHTDGAAGRPTASAE